MTDYFVSTQGRDDASGTSSTSPWRSITRLNAAFASGMLRLGDTVRLRRGDVFAGRLRQPDMLDPAYGGWLRIGAYGDGAAPVVDGYKYVTTWTPHAADVWRVEYGASGSGTRYVGYDSAQGDGDVGHLLVNGIVRGVRRAGVSELRAQWDFCSAGTTLYVKSAQNPAAHAHDIGIAVDGDGSNQRSGVWMSDIVVRGHGGHGIAAPGMGGSTRTRVTGCEVYACGGSALDGYGNGAVRYGNGIQAWVGTRDMVIEGNRVHDCYDAAITVQGGDAGVAGAFADVVVRGNVTYRCSQGLEFWYRGRGPGFARVLVEGNDVVYSGYGWGAQVRPEQQTRVALLTFEWDARADLVLKRNAFYDSAHAYRYSSVDPRGLIGGANIVALRGGTLMSHQRPETIAQAASWNTADGHELSLRAFALPPHAGSTDAHVASALAHIARLRG